MGEPGMACSDSLATPLSAPLVTPVPGPAYGAYSRHGAGYGVSEPLPLAPGAPCIANDPLLSGTAAAHGLSDHLMSDPAFVSTMASTVPGAISGQSGALMADPGPLSATGSAPPGLSDEELVSLVDRITEEGFLNFVDGFVEENAHYFVEGEEHRHYYNEVHQKYQRFFEARVEAWLRERGQSPEAFAWAVLQGGIANDVAEELLAVSDYEVFVAMMRSRRHLAMAEAAA